MQKESADIWNDAARSLEFQQNFPGAAQCYERAKRCGDESAETLVNLAVSHMRMYSFRNDEKYLSYAKGFLLSAMEKGGQEAKSHHYLGVVYLALGEKEKATEEFLCEAEKNAEQGLLFEMNIQLPAYEEKRHEVYELFPDPALYRVYDLVKDFPLDKQMFGSLRETYGDKDTASLIALYLRSIYFKVFESREFADGLGLSSEQEKWEALLVFFVRGINDESRELVTGALAGGKLEVSKLPAYSGLLVNRYRGEILGAATGRESFRALLHLPLRKLEILNEVCEEAKARGGNSRRMKTILEKLSAVGLAWKKGQSFALSESLLKGFGGIERVRAKVGAREYDAELFALLYGLFKKRRFEYALELAKRVRSLYDEGEAGAYIKEIVSSIYLSEEEKFAIMSEA